MRPLMIAFLVLIAMPALAQKHKGRTCEQVLQMGHDKWVEFYTAGKKNITTADMVDSSTIYGNCLAKKNKAALTKLSEGDRRWLQLNYGAIRAVTDDLWSLEARHGGTMFAIIAAGEYVESKELFAKTIRLGGSRAKATPAQVRRREQLVKKIRDDFVKMATHLKKEPEIPNNLGHTSKTFLSWAYRARGNFEKWLKGFPADRAAIGLLALEHLSDALNPENFGG